MNNKKITIVASIALSLCGLTACNDEAKTPLAAADTSLTTSTTQNTMSLTYPNTKKIAVVDDYFGTKVTDNYRWLEDDMSEETATWVKAQNVTTQDYLAKIPYRDQIKTRLSALLDYEKIGMPFIEGDYTYFYKNDGLQNQYVLYRQKGDEPAEIFLNPNEFSEDGTVSLASIEFSADGSLAVYLISEGGSDWRKAHIIDTKTKKELEPQLVDIKFSGLSWVGNEGFYYSSYDKPKGSELSAKTDQHKLYYHKLGTPQTEDVLVFGGTEAQKHRYVGGEVTKDGKYLMVYAAVSTSGSKLFIKDLTKADSALVTVVGNTDSDTSLVHNNGDELLLITIVYVFW